MIDLHKLKVDNNSSLLEMSKVVQRGMIEKTDDGEILNIPHVQFQLKNISNDNLVDLEIELNHYNNENEFIGTDSDLRLEKLAPNEIETVNLLLDETSEPINYSELIIRVSRPNFRDKIGFIRAMISIILLGLLIYNNVEN